MKKILLLPGIIFLGLIGYAQRGHDARNMSFDATWLFLKNSSIDASQPLFDDTKWRTINVPHDWSVEDLGDKNIDTVVGPFFSGSGGQSSTGFTVGGTAWYRKKFFSESSFHDHIVSIRFDGVYMNSDIWLNGHYLGNHPYGYTPFSFDITAYLAPNKEQNVLAVRVRNEGKNSRWYSGSGIYRHVWLTVTPPIHIDDASVFVTTPEVLPHVATTQLVTTIDNNESSEAKIDLVTTIISPAGRAIGKTQKDIRLPAHGSVNDLEKFTVPDPLLWSVETPRLYKAVTVIKKSGRTLDSIETVFGIRSLSFSTKEGFLLNGKRLLLKGGCIHHDNGPLGSATIDRAEERKIEILKKNGFNAIRTSHNPPSPQLLAACDKLGMLVIDEAFDMWERGKNSDDYHLYFKGWWQNDLDAMILRDRNHPSVIFWSIGNEINERADTSGLRIAKMLKNEVRRLDTTRPVTEAICSFWDHPGYRWDTAASAFAVLDVGGYNYMLQQYEGDHQKFPARIMMGTESVPQEALENWNKVENLPYVIGDFVWTAIDYLGEAAIGHATFDKNKTSTFFIGWPWFNSFCGDIDLIGEKKPQSYYRDVVWKRKPIAMAVQTPIPDGLVENVSYWGWPNEQQSWSWGGFEGKSMQVRVFSRARVVRLLLNGKVVGEKNIPDSTITTVFTLPYQPGILKAVNVVNGKEADAITFKTAGAPARIRLTSDRSKVNADKNNLSYILVEIVDAHGMLVPNAEIPVSFSVTGAGDVAAVGSGNPTDMSSFQSAEKKSWQGKCLVIVRPNGKPGAIKVTASAKGLLSGQTTITTVK